MLAHIFGLLLVATVGIASYFLLRYPERGLKDVLSVKDLGILEGSLKDLSQVVVVADHVEAPSDALRQAVEKNLARGVQYRFLISQSKAADELDGYYQLFEALAKIARKRSGTDVRELVNIQQLPYDWVETPYIFYRLPAQESPDSFRYVAVRGNQRYEGIADFYSYLEPEYAHMIGRAILADAPSPIIVSSEQFKDSNVVDFPAKSATGT